MPVPNTAAESLRFDVSPEASAAVASGFFKDLIEAGHLKEEMSYLALDPSKLCRASQTVMTTAQKKEEENTNEEKIESIYFDRRKDMTRVLIPDSKGRLHPRKIREEHVSVTSEPSGHYLAH